MKKDYNISMNKERVKKEFWISPDGKINRFTGDISGEIVSMHSEIASQIYPNSNRPTDILFNLGWIMVGSTVYGNPITHKTPTNKQIKRLEKLELLEYLLILDKNLYVKYVSFENELK